MMLLALTALCAAKTVKATSRTFARAVSRDPFTLVLFTSTRCSACRKIQTAMDAISVKYDGAIGFVTLDIDTSGDICQKYNVPYSPAILVFKGGKYRHLYLGDWSQSTLTEFCDAITKYEVRYLNSTFDVFDFQHKGISNLLLSKPELINKADSLLDKLGGITEIGVLTNDELVEQLKLPPAQFTRTNDFVTFDLDNVDDSTIDPLVVSPYQHIQYHELFGNTPTKDTVFVLLDERDPLMIHDAVKRFDAIRAAIGNNVSFQYCDFFTCANLVQQLKLIAFHSPVFIMHQKLGNRIKIEPFQKVGGPVSEIVDWAKHQILGIEPPAQKKQVQIPKLSAHEFIPVLQDPKKDIILLLAAPRMQLYEESQESFRAIITAMKSKKNVKFYEFNPVTEHVQGLKLPESDKPQISVWPAGEQRSGSAFPGFLNVNVIFDQLVKLITTKIDDDELEDMMEVISEYMNNRE